MTTTRRFRFAALTAAAMAAASGSAQAADVGWLHFNGIGPDPIIVLSNGQEYTKIKQLGIFSISTQLHYDTGVAGRIKSYWVQPDIRLGFGIAAEIPGMSAFKVSKSYPVGSRPKEINKNVMLSVPFTSMAASVVGMCNLKASVLRSQGQGNQAIFSQNHDLSLKVSAKWDVDANGAGSGSPILEATGTNTVKVICQKWSGAQIPQGSGDIAAAARVEHATLKVLPQPTHNGSCKVKLTGLVRLNRANYTVKVQFEHSTGSKSEVMSFQTAANKIGMVHRMVDIPKQPGQEAGWFKMNVISPTGGTTPVGYMMNCSDVGGFKAPQAGRPTGPNTLAGGKQTPPPPQLQLKLKSN